MVGLNDLPYDIKDPILFLLYDRKSLFSLISTSKSFYNVFETRRTTILNNIYFIEADSYGADAYMYSYCHRHVLANTLTEHAHIMDSYVQFMITWIQPTDLEIPSDRYNPSKLRTYIIEDYLFARKMA